MLQPVFGVVLTEVGFANIIGWRSAGYYAILRQVLGPVLIEHVDTPCSRLGTFGQKEKSILAD